MFGPEFQSLVIYSFFIYKVKILNYQKQLNVTCAHINTHTATNQRIKPSIPVHIIFFFHPPTYPSINLLINSSLYAYMLYSVLTFKLVLLSCFSQGNTQSQHRESKKNRRVLPWKPTKKKKKKKVFRSWKEFMEVILRYFVWVVSYWIHCLGCYWGISRKYFQQVYQIQAKFTWTEGKWGEVKVKR